MARLTLRSPRRRRLGAFLGSLAILAVVVSAGAPRDAVAGENDEVRILAGEPSTFDPAATGDATTAAITAQVYETLTTYDATLTLQPALAASWDVAPDGLSVVFHMRPSLQFSDGSSLTARDVVGSWLRIIDPRTPSPLAALMIDVKGARAYLSGQTSDPAAVGIRANGDDVEVELERPGADFPAIVSSPTFGIVPTPVWQDGRDLFGPGAPGSGGFTVEAVNADEITLTRNERYWAGAPAIQTVHLLLDLGGQNPVAAFDAGDLDYTEISSIDAPWIPYDRDLGPQLREVSSLSLTYLGIDTTTAPFDDVRVRQALGAAVDWARIVPLGASEGATPAISMVPPGIPGGGDRNWLPAHDPELARQLLTEAGYPGGAGLPPIRFAAGLLPLADAIAADLERELGMQVELESLDDHLGRLDSDPPNLWVTGWIADYVGPNDFLGVLLESDSGNNDGRWSSAAFDKAIAEALATRDPAAAQVAYERAMAEIQAEVPVVPLYLSTNWFLSREGLLGAGDNGLGILRVAGMSWAR